MLDRMTPITAQLNRLGTNVDQTFELSTFVRQLPYVYLSLKKLLEGQDFDRDEIFTPVKAHNSSLKGQSKDDAFVSQGREGKQDCD